MSSSTDVWLVVLGDEGTILDVCGDWAQAQNIALRWAMQHDLCVKRLSSIRYKVGDTFIQLENREVTR